MAENRDINASARKKDHIGLAFESQTLSNERDDRFYYEPAISHMNDRSQKISVHFIGQHLEVPMWVSSMTGGTEKANKINHNLAKACNEFGMGMGLGSCRQLLYSDEYLGDFDVRDTIGIQPLYANLGIAQMIEIVRNESYDTVIRLIDRLRADGLIIHINPLQEWMQPEGDLIDMNPIECIQKVTENTDLKIIVKEVGQGFGPESLRALLSLDIAGIELAGFGGTNFTKVEAGRRDDCPNAEFIHVGHTANEMVDFLNDIAQEDSQSLKKHIIISGGIRDYLTGYYLNKKCQYNSVYGQASQFLKYALDDYSTLAKYVETQIKGYQMAKNYLKIKA